MFNRCSLSARAEILREELKKKAIILGHFRKEMSLPGLIPGT